MDSRKRKWTEQSYLNSKLEGMSSAGQMAVKVIGMIANGICKFKNFVMKIFEVLFNGGGKSFLEGRYGSGIVMSRRIFFKKLINKARSIARRIVGRIKKAGTAIANRVKKVGQKIVRAAKWVTDKINMLGTPLALLLKESLLKLKICLLD